MSDQVEIDRDKLPFVAAGSLWLVLRAVVGRAHRRSERRCVEVAEFTSGLTALDRAWMVIHSVLVSPGARRSLWVLSPRPSRRAMIEALVRSRFQRRPIVAYRAMAGGRIEPVRVEHLQQLSTWLDTCLLVVVDHRRHGADHLRSIWTALLASPIPPGKWGAGPTRFQRVTMDRGACHERGPRGVRWSDDRESFLEAQRQRSVDVVIPVHDAVDAALRCLRSVEATRDRSRHRIIVVDDGSTPATAAALQRFVDDQSGVVLIRHDVARGFSGAANAGLRASTAEMVVVLNSDTEVSADWIGKLADSMFRPAGVGIVGPLSNAASHQSLPRASLSEAERAAGMTVFNDLPDGCSIEEVNRRLEHHAKVQPVRTSMVHGFCFAVRREVIDSVGLLDEDNFPRGYGEEFDYCFRIADAGWSAVIATNTYVWHTKTQSFTAEERARLDPLGIATVERLYGSQRRQLASRILSRNPELARLRHVVTAPRGVDVTTQGPGN